ncbi:glycosyltransferase [Pararhizobium sp.]|uniref:glycosyltransferase n=1 Tax=Pararhizobium sp. TaxID=1977563 RepID=UPI002727626B|nr:glycosyltransferase family 4 protein [Pararhizobium sp.]MDO9418264.1 glycosyltransferase family 4 protein [Pararhizobium sp.]
MLISSLVPVANPASGFDIANRVILDGLRQLGHTVSVVGYLQPGQTPADPDATHILGELEVTNSRVGAARRAGWLARAIAANTAVSSAKMLAVSSTRIQSILKTLEPFDGLVLNSVQLPGAFQPIFRRYPYIYVAHNVEFQSALQNAQQAEGWLERMLFKREAHYLERMETGLARDADWVWTFAEEDRFGFGQSGARNATALPLVTSVSEPVQTAGEVIEHDLGLIGTWSWKANRIGLDWFLNEVTPLLPKEFRIAIAGQFPDPPPVSHPGVCFVGRVPDARAFARSCQVLPLVSKAGSGVQLKTIEAFELGLPVVATRASLRGIGAPPENCLIEDDAHAFANACIRLVSAARLGVSARLDGRIFHRAQIEALLEKMGNGLARLGQASHPPVVAPSLAAVTACTAPLSRVQNPARERSVL